MNTPEQSQSLFARAQELIPGGVNSPVRAFGSVGGTPRFMQRADRQMIYDVDGNAYVDYIGSWGPMILGHNHPAVLKAVQQAIGNGLSFGAATQAEVEMASLVCSMVPSVEMVRMVNSGTEAVMSAVRAARGYTGRDRIIKFAGCYHGHCDAMLVKAGSGVMTSGVPDSAGVPAGCAMDTLTAAYNDLDSVRELFSENPGQVAAVILEPVAANMGVVEPKEGFLKGLRQLCDENGAVLIFDEVITGFRLSLTGAQGVYGVTPDLCTFGKIIGAGMPVGAYGGKREIMQTISPVGRVYQAGTLSGNPVAMAAGIAQLSHLRDTPEVYTQVNALGDYLRDGMRRVIEAHHASCQVTGVGSLCCLFFTPEPVTDYESAKTADTARFARYFHFMLQHGQSLAPSQFEAIFLSCAHTRENLDEYLELLDRFFAQES